MFTRGDYVRTTKGARFEGVVLAVFENLRGKLRMTVEATHPDFEETIHVYPVEQMELVKAAD